MSIPRTMEAHAPRSSEPGMTSSASETMDPVLALVLARVRLRARRRVEWLRALWRQGDGPTSPEQVTHAEIDRHLDDRDNPDAEMEWLDGWVGVEGVTDLIEVENEIRADATSRLARLCRTFALGEVEVDVVHACLAATLDPSILRVYAYLQDHAGRPYVTDWLVARLFQHGRTLLLDADAPVLRWAIVTSAEGAPGEPRVHLLDPAIRDWLLGSDALDADLAPVARLHDEQPPLTEWPVDETVQALKRWLTGHEPTPVRVRIAGAQGSGRRTFAAAVAARVGLPLLAIDAGAVDDAHWPRVYMKAQRRAFLDGCALALVGESAFTRPRPEIVAHFPLQFLIGESAHSAPLPARSVDYLVEIPPSSLETRRALWRRYAPWSATWLPEARESLIAQHRALPADLVRIGRRGPSPSSEATALLRESARESLGDLALRLECPFQRDDLVVGAPLQEALEDLLFEAHERVAFWERPEARRLFPQGRGLLALLCGPPGTGKTMSAQVIAATLGVDLFRIDLASVVSKWVGETSRNIDKLLTRAARVDSVLLFDEADALFGKRTEIKEANDRFANTDTGYLLQAIESYHGIALLSSNRKSDIDPAFLRRLRYVLDYPLPDEGERLRMWRRMIADLLGEESAQALRGDLERIAASVEVTGAQIKFAVLSAIFGARRDERPVELKHLLRGLERELAKEGRPLNDRVRDRLGPRAR